MLRDPYHNYLRLPVSVEYDGVEAGTLNALTLHELGFIYHVFPVGRIDRSSFIFEACVKASSG